MAETAFFKEAFDGLAQEGCIGDPRGELAYAYLRVSSAGQADEGRSGLPRQLLHCHEVARRHNLKIPWNLVFADDHTGFEFRERPELTRLREEYNVPARRANAIVMENLDRLSRNADWHQGFLLDEMKEHHLQVIFWKEFSSRIERAVIGAISQEGMEQAKQRMAEGNLYKARDNRVTARVPAFGYTLVDRFGQSSPEAKKDTHYAIHPEESPIVGAIFRSVGIEGRSLHSLAKWLDDHYPPMKRFRRWEPKMLGHIIRNPVYKGEFLAHRYTYVKVPSASQNPNEPVLLVWKKIERPPNEWIRVSVPPIVSGELWEMANLMLKKNSQMGRRRAKEPYLLTGLIKCASCGYAYTGRRRRTVKNNKEYVRRYYRDSSSLGLMGIFRDVHCTQSQVSCERLDEAVWNAISDALLNPENLISTMEREYAAGPNAQLLAEIDFLEKQVGDIAVEDEDLYRAYRARAFDEQEYAARREALKDRRKKLEQEKTELANRVLSPEMFELNKERILRQSELLREQGLAPNPPFEVKQTILKLVVERIKLNVAENWFEIEGVIPGFYELDVSTESIPMHRDSSRRAAQISPPK